MTWQGRTLTTLTTLYTAVALWLAYCTVQTWSHVPLWVSLTMAAASLTPIIARLREATHTIDMHLLRAELERATRPRELPPVITPEERARFDTITAGFNDKDQAA